MKRMTEDDVLHLGRTISEWRAIVGCVRNTAKVCAGAERQRLERIASELEGHLPNHHHPEQSR